MEAVGARDLETVKEVTGYHDFTVDLVRFLFDSSFFEEFGSDGVSVLETVSSDDLVVVVEAAKVGGVWKANIFFVQGERLEYRGLPVLAQLSGLKVMRDYVVCPVEYVDGQVRLAGSLCMAETEFD